MLVSLPVSLQKPGGFQYDVFFPLWGQTGGAYILFFLEWARFLRWWTFLLVSVLLFFFFGTRVDLEHNVVRYFRTGVIGCFTSFSTLGRFQTVLGNRQPI